MNTSVLKSLSVSTALENDKSLTFNILVDAETPELGKIRELQAEINAVITEKISSLKGEGDNNLFADEQAVEEECETEDDDDGGN